MQVCSSRRLFVVFCEESLPFPPIGLQGGILLVVGDNGVTTQQMKVRIDDVTFKRVLPDARLSQETEYNLA